MGIDTVAKQIAIFTPDTKEFQPIQTDMGILFVKLIDIKPYANGYRVVISIGNPNNAVFSNLNINVTFGRSKNNGLDILSSHQYKTTIPGDLLPGYWNNESLILAPAEKEDIQNLWISITPNETKLKTLPNAMNSTNEND